MSPEFESLYNNVTKALEELLIRVREDELETTDDPDWESKMQEGSIMAHWAVTVGFVGVDDYDNTKNSIYIFSAPGTDAITSLGLYKAGLLHMERCI